MRTHTLYFIIANIIELKASQHCFYKKYISYYRIRNS